MEQVKHCARGSAQDCTTAYRHSLLQLMPYGGSAPPYLLKLQELVNAVLSREAGLEDCLASVVTLQRHLQAARKEIPGGEALLEEVLAELAQRTPCPRVLELLSDAYLESAGLRVDFFDEIGIERGLPAVWRGGVRSELRVFSPCARTVKLWASAVRTLCAADDQELNSLDPEDVQAALRLLQLHVLLGEESRGRTFGGYALTFFEGQGVALWNDLLSRVATETRADPDWAEIYGELRQRAVWHHLRGQAAVGAWPDAESSKSPATDDLPRTVGPAKPGWHVVIAGQIPPATSDDERAALKRFEPLQRAIQVAALPTREQINSIQSSLLEEFPWAAEAVRALVADLRARKLFGGIELGITPTLLVGLPGSGKSRLVRRIAEELQLPFCPLALAGMNDSKAIVGTARGWASGQASPFISSMLRHSNASALVLLDEIDKVGSSSRHSSPPTDALLNLLEPENAKRWYDTFLQTPCDLGKLMFIATANRLSPLSKPLLSRFRVVLVPEPSPEHFGAIARGAVLDIAREWGLPRDTFRELAPAIPLQRVRNAREVKEVARTFLHDWGVGQLGRERLH